MIKTVTAIRYITPLREGGSLPAVVEADDGEMYVMKFVGAGQGPKALIAELVAGEIGRLLGLRVPEPVLLELDHRLGRAEPNAEIQDLLQRSANRLNLGLRYLPNAFEFNLLLKPPPKADLASTIVWFDAYVTNVDRTARNVNMLLWQEGLWLIDHGASLYFHHDWNDYLQRSRSPFKQIKDHTLISLATNLREVDQMLRPRLTPEVIREVVNMIPDEWLGQEAAFASQPEHREAYVTYLLNRLDASSVFVEEAINAHKAHQ
ncbi:MAG: aminotransferase class I and II [Anaerolineae bacterium]|nr:aminotransferase class I and II [Anaerolineae bacterium]